MTIRQARIVDLAGPKGDEIALISRLFSKVQKMNEQHYVHGRFLEPGIITYEGRYVSDNPDEYTDSSSRAASFICLPFFDLRNLRPSNHTKDSHAHPIRNLMQTRYRLESTTTRDRNQVVNKAKFSENGSCISLPQLWAVIINERRLEALTVRRRLIRGLQWQNQSLLVLIVTKQSSAARQSTCCLILN